MPEHVHSNFNQIMSNSEGNCSIIRSCDLHDYPQSKRVKWRRQRLNNLHCKAFCSNCEGNCSLMLWACVHTQMVNMLLSQHLSFCTIEAMIVNAQALTQQHVDHLFMNKGSEFKGAVAFTIWWGIWMQMPSSFQSNNQLFTIAYFMIADGTAHARAATQ